MQATAAALGRLGRTLRLWVDSDAPPVRGKGDPDAVQWGRVLPFALLHLACLGVIWVGWSTTAGVVALTTYLVRMFALTAFYHRYFSHRAFRTSRFVQFLGGFLGNASAQRGPLWWAAHHRHHHRHSDTGADAHSPHEHSFLWSHMGWFTSERNFATDYEVVSDFARYPELRFLNRFDAVAPLALLLGLFGLGEMLAWLRPDLGTNGLQLVVWGFFVSTVLLFHVTCMINSIAHRYGSRAYATRDQSRNSMLVALLTMGEGWHNNHHYYAGSVRQGFRWWQIDVTYYVLVALSWLGIVRDLRPVPERVVAEGRAR